MHQTHLTRHTFPKMANLHIPNSPFNLLISTFSWLYVYQDDQIKCSYLTRWYILYVFFPGSEFLFCISLKRNYFNYLKIWCQSNTGSLNYVNLGREKQKTSEQRLQNYDCNISYNHWQFIFIIKLVFFFFFWTRVY